MTSALNAAGSQTTGKIVLTNTYKISDVISTNIPIEGVSPSQAIIDASGADASSWTTEVDGHKKIIKAVGGGLTQISDLSSDVSKGDISLTFSSAPSGVSEGDILLIYNPTDSSYSGWRTYYRAGEFVKVKAISGTTVDLQWGILSDDGYTAASVDVYKLSPITIYFRNFKIQGIGDDTVYEDALEILYGADCFVENVIVEDFSYSGIHIRQSYNVEVKNCRVYSDVSNPVSNIYPLFINNSQKIFVLGGDFSSWWHAAATGGGDYIGCVPCREISFIGGKYTNTTGSIQAIGTHGNTEYLTISNCTLYGGVIVAGNYNNVIANQILGPISNGAAIRATELSGLNHIISDNYVYTDYFDTNWSTFFDIGGGSAVLSDNTPHGGTVVISNNNVVVDFTGISSNIYKMMSLINGGYSGSDEINIYVSGNVVRKVSGSSTLSYGIRIKVDAGNNWNNVTVLGNVICGGINATCADVVMVKDNEFFDIYQAPGIWLTQIGFHADVQGNYIINSDFTPIYITGSDKTVVTVHVKGNIIKDFVMASSGSSANRSCIFLNDLLEAHIYDNVFTEPGDYLTRLLNVTSNVVQLFASDNRFDSFDGSATHKVDSTGSNFSSSPPPTAGTWVRGDVAWDYAPSAGGPPGYVCVTTGGSYGSTRANSTNYSVGDWVLWSSGTTVWMCITAGTTDSSAPDITGKTVGDTVTDGTVVWLMMSTTAAEWKAMADLAP